MRNALSACLFGLAAMLAFAGFNGPALADLRVIDSNMPGVAIDTAFPDNAVFDVPAGRKLKFLKTPANSTHEIAGPYKGTLDAYTPACSWVDWAMGKCSRSTDQTGGTRSAPVPGATRGLMKPPPAQSGN